MATTREINWGGVAKGAIVLTAVVAAVAVGYWAFSAATPHVMGYIGSSPALGSFLDSATSLATSAWDQIKIFGDWLGKGIAAAPAAVASTLGLENNGKFLELFKGTDVAKTAGIVGAVGMGAVGLGVSIPNLRETALTVPVHHPDPSHHATIAQAHAAHHGLHEASHTAQHHAAESRGHSGSWTSKTSIASRTPGASFSETVGQRPVAASVQPRCRAEAVEICSKLHHLVRALL
jgi:hypothetical protein